MFPIPIENFLPKIYRDNPDAAYLALAAKMNSILTAWETELLELYFLKVADRCPVLLLDELGNNFAAGLKQYDTETIKRKKIDGAVAQHKIRGLWLTDVKVKIDTITGYDAQLVMEEGSGVMLAYNMPWVEVTPPLDTTRIQFQAIDYSPLAPPPYGFIGLKETSPGGDVIPEVRGTIYIDCHAGINASTLTAAQIAQIVDEITDSVPCYYKIFLCWLEVVLAIYPVIRNYAGGEIG